VPGILELGAYQTPMQLGIDRRPDRRNFPFETRPGKAMTATRTRCPLRTSGMSLSATLAFIQIREIVRH